VSRLEDVIAGVDFWVPDVREIIHEREGAYSLFSLPDWRGESRSLRKAPRPCENQPRRRARRNTELRSLLCLRFPHQDGRRGDRRSAIRLDPARRGLAHLRVPSCRTVIDVAMVYRPIFPAVSESVLSENSARASAGAWPH
jgi:hypothetical protein